MKKIALLSLTILLWVNQTFSNGSETKEAQETKKPLLTVAQKEKIFKIAAETLSLGLSAFLASLAKEDYSIARNASIYRKIAKWDEISTNTLSAKELLKMLEVRIKCKDIHLNHLINSLGKGALSVVTATAGIALILDAFKIKKIENWLPEVETKQTNSNV